MQHFAVVYNFRIGPEPVPRIEYFGTEDQTRARAKKVHKWPNTVDVEMRSYPYDGVKAEPSTQDIKMGARLAAILDDPGACPTLKFDITNWLDSKDWLKVS